MPTDTFETLRLTRHDNGVLLVTLNRPEVRNAFNTQMGTDLREVFRPLAYEPLDLRCIVITGEGDKAFCAGGDLKERNGMTEAQWLAQHAIFEEAFYSIMGCVVPTIAAVNGAAYAGGCELALACDFVYAVPAARFALTEVSLGIIPGCGGTQNLPRAIGSRRAKEVLLTASPFTAEEAMQWGMVNRIVPPGELLDSALATARKIASHAPLAARQAKAAVDRGLDVDRRTGLHFEIEAYRRTIDTEDRLEGIRAFNEKRPPVFKGR